MPEVKYIRLGSVALVIRVETLVVVGMSFMAARKSVTPEGDGFASSI